MASSGHLTMGKNGTGVPPVGLESQPDMGETPMPLNAWPRTEDHGRSPCHGQRSHDPARRAITAPPSPGRWDDCGGTVRENRTRPLPGMTAGWHPGILEVLQRAAAALPRLLRVLFRQRPRAEFHRRQPGAVAAGGAGDVADRGTRGLGAARAHGEPRTALGGALLVDDKDCANTATCWRRSRGGWRRSECVVHAGPARTETPGQRGSTCTTR